MPDLRTRLKNFRRSSSSTPAKSTPVPDPSSDLVNISRTWSKSSTRLGKDKRPSITVASREIDSLRAPLPLIPPTQAPAPSRVSPPAAPSVILDSSLFTPPEVPGNPKVAIEPPTPERRGRTDISTSTAVDPAPNPGRLGEVDAKLNSAPRQTIATRRQSPIPHHHTTLFSELGRSEDPQRRAKHSENTNNAARDLPKMHRKVWVKRPNATATQVTINEEDLVDDVKDMILRKYTNSLGRNFDPPDVTLKVILREQHGKRSVTEQTLAPEDNMIRTLEYHFPGGQRIGEALLVDVPRRTPKHSPNLAMPYYVTDQIRPVENGTDYFPPMPIAGPQSPNLPTDVSVSSGKSLAHRPPQHPHSISVLETGHVPNLPSPGSRMVRHSARPRFGRQQTSSPTVLNGSKLPGNHDLHVKALGGQVLATPPVPVEIKPHRSSTPPPRPSSPRPKAPKKAKKPPADVAPASGAILDGAVPPINVLIVEDNMINLKLLEAFLKRLKVRWKTAMNGRDAVTTWRQGGFHLVVMDIQMPVMNGLDATKEIRRLERVNNIGVFSNNAASTPAFREVSDAAGGPGEGPGEEGRDEDLLENTELFKSPVIIVALTASSLQSDRHEALAAGCNDFLTKPVSFDWLSRKVMEWGCMQALIDFDGWRKWKDFSSQATKDSTAAKTTPNNNNNNTKATAATAALPPSPSQGVKSPKGTMANGGKTTKAMLVPPNNVSEGSDGTDTNGEEGSGGEVLISA